MDETDRAAIAEAVRQAEAKSSGEIVVVIDRAAASYRWLPVLIAWGIGLLLPWPLLALTMTSAPRIFMVQLVVAAVLTLALLWFGRGARFVPGFFKRRRAHETALREFTARGLTRTAGRTGVLLYVALQERFAEIIPDSAIDGKVAPERWDAIIALLLDAAKDGRLRDGLIAAVAQIGDELAIHAPARPGDVDELPNHVILL